MGWIIRGILLKPITVGPYAEIIGTFLNAFTADIDLLAYLTTVCIVIAGAHTLAMLFQIKQSEVDINKLFEKFLPSLIYYL